MNTRAPCLEHVYRLIEVEFRRGGAWSIYVCIRCDEEREVGPDEVPPQTV